MKRNPKKIVLYVCNADAEVKCNQFALGAFIEFSRGSELDKAIGEIINSLRTYRMIGFKYDRIEPLKQTKVEKPKTTNQ